MAGAQMRYLVRWRGQVLCALGFGACAWRLASREEFIGWSDAQRRARLHLVVNNSRFLILPWVRCPNLGSGVLGLCARRIGGDFARRYGYVPVLLESFVEEPRFTGTVYRAASWTPVGMTVGRGKEGFSSRGPTPQADLAAPAGKRFSQSALRSAQWGCLHGRGSEILSEWIESEFKSTDLGDARLDARLRTILTRMWQSPLASISSACCRFAEVMAASRFFDNEAMTQNAILEPHRAAIVNHDCRMAGDVCHETGAAVPRSALRRCVRRG